MGRTIVSYSGKDLYDMSQAVTDGLKGIQDVFGSVETSFANTGLGGTAGTDIKSPVADAVSIMDQLEKDLTNIDTTLQEEIKVDNATKTAVDAIYDRPIIL